VRYYEIISEKQLTEDELEEAARPNPTEVVKALVSHFHEAPYEINNGQCEEFAEQLAEVLGPAADAIDALNLCKNNEIHASEWDVKFITLHWPQCQPTHGLTWEDIRFSIPQHAWVVYNDWHYDAECPQGVINFFELPLIARGLARIAARKAKSAA
jgi:hypothetical protein